MTLAGLAGIERGARAAPEAAGPDQACIWPVAEVMRTHLPCVAEVPESLRDDLPRGPWPAPAKQVAVLPILPTGETGRAGALVVGLNPFRQFDDNYSSFLGLVAGQIASAIANAQAYEEERRRAEALAEVDRAKTTFFSNVSHEFRTPLTLMLGPLEDALNDAELELPRLQRGRLETAQRNSLRLLKLVNSLLDFSRIEAGRIDARFEAVDLSGLTAELASSFESAMQRAALTLRIDCQPLPKPAYVDRDMWEKIVLNLLSNAFKFTFAGEVSVSVRAAAGGNAAEMVIRDTGVGIPPDELPRLFERFHRIEGQRSRSFEGSGIGLALVQELVRLHGGSIRAESAVGEGTAFIVSVPLGAAHLRDDQGGGERARAGTSMRADAYVEEALRWLPDRDATEGPADRADDAFGVMSGSAPEGAHLLVADDNADMRAYIRRLLGSTCEVETVSDGLQALQAIRARKPDLLLTDVMMPQLDGFGLLRQIRADPALRDLPVIVLSARAGEEARIEGLEGGADDYLTKPFSARELVARVHTNLEMARIRRDAMRELRESEQRFRNMADHAPVMMWVTDVSGALTYLNRAWSEFTGQTPEQALGYGAWDALHPDDAAHGQQIFLAANAAREAFRIEYRLRRADGVYRWALSAASPRFGGDGDFLGYIGSVIDITERKEAEQILRESNQLLEQRVAEALAERAEAEEQLRQAQKMEAIGKLTGGVAHDFNNVLQVISGNLQLLARDVAGNLRAEQRLQTAVTATPRGSKLSSQLLAFGRRQPLAPRVVNLGRLIRNIDEMLRRALGEGIEIETMVAGGLWNNFVDLAQVENALLNLAINSRDAMNGHGKLTIEAGNAFIDDNYADRHVEVVAGQYVVLAVTDTGCGIPREIVDRIFEPFFTTKPEGKGTGLGLSMVYGFVKQSGGHVKVYSELGHGTTVKIYLPRARQEEEAEAEHEAMVQPAGGSETVLVAEDDEDVRATVVDMLVELGYRVLKAKDAQGALAIVESGVPIDLLFTDVVMPGALRSADLARKAKERLPGLAVLFTSGYTENSIVHGGRLDDGIELLSKPYTKEALARKIRHSLRNQQQRNRPPEKRQDEWNAKSNAPKGARSLRLLLVEDDELIRAATLEMLSDAGHSVAEAADATEAMGLLDASDFDVMVTDLALPGVSGDELARAALRRRPDLRIVFASGYGVQPKLGENDTSARVTLLRKPYDERAMLNALEMVMGGLQRR